MSAQRPPKAVPGLEGGFSTAPTTTPRTKTAEIANSKEALRGRITYTAGPSLTRYSTYPADGISPEMIKACLRNADLGYPRLQAEMYEQVIENYAHLRGVAKARIYEVSGKPWRIAPRDETPVAMAVAKFTRAALDEIDGFESDLDDLLWANGNGYAASEIIWRFDRIRFPLAAKGETATVQAFVPGSLEWVHAKHFEFDAITDEPYLWLSGARVPLPPNKFVFHVAADTGLIERRGYMRPCLPLYAMQAWARRNWILEGELYSVPQLTGTYPADNEEYDAQREVLKAVLRDWGKGIPAVMPSDVEFKGTTIPTKGASGIQAALLGYCNQEISKLIQGETLTTEVGNVGAYAATETHADVRFAFIRADARKLEQTLRSDLLRPIVHMNADVLASALGVSPEEVMRCVPLIHWRIDRETSPTQRADNLIKLANAGVPISLDQVNDECGIDPPREGAQLLRGNPVTVADGGVAVGSQAATSGVDNPKDPKPESTPAPKQDNSAPEPAGGGD